MSWNDNQNIVLLIIVIIKDFVDVVGFLEDKSRRPQLFNDIDGSDRLWHFCFISRG